MTARSCETQTNHHRRGQPLGRIQPIVPGKKLYSFGKYFTFGWHTLQVTEPAQLTLRQGDRNGGCLLGCRIVVFRTW